MKVNYDDLYRVYHGIYNQPETPVEKEEVLPIQPVSQPPRKKKRKRCKTVIVKTIVDDPMRDLLKTTAGMALGYGIGKYLGLFGD